MKNIKWEILNYPGDTMRLNRCITDISNQSVKIDYSVFTGYLTDDPNYRCRGVLKSVKEMIKKHYNEPCFGQFEDDVLFTSHRSIEYFYKKVELIESQVDVSRIGVIAGGVFFTFFLPPKEPYFKLTRRFAGFHMVLIYKPLYDLLLNFDDTTQPPGLQCPDGYTGLLGAENKIDNYCVYKMCAHQYDGFSHFEQQQSSKPKSRRNINFQFIGNNI